MATTWSVLLNRIDNALGNPPWKEWRAMVVSASEGAASAGSIPMLGADGKLDPSMVSSSGTTIDLQTDGVPNPVQDVLNLIEGTNVTLTADSAGGVTIAASGDLSTGFESISSGTNTTANMVVGNGATLEATGNGVVNATEINGIPIIGALTHAGQIPISQPGNTEAVWADPFVQGIQAVGTSVSTVNPVLIGVEDENGNLQNLTLDSNGNFAVDVVNFAQPTTFNTVQATHIGNTPIWSPASGKKFRLLKYQIESTMNVSQVNQGVLTISFQDGTNPISLAHDVYVPSTARVVNISYSSGWIDLGGTGFLSVAANNVLSVNLSEALTAGNFRINVAGTEE